MTTIKRKPLAEVHAGECTIKNCNAEVFHCLIINVVLVMTAAAPIHHAKSVQNEMTVEEYLTQRCDEIIKVR